MKTGADLEPEFRKTLSRFTDDENIVTSLWQDVLNHYTEPLRHYHSLVHLNNIVTILCQVKNEIHDWDILILAIAYHDIIYNVYKSDNEEKSAAYACKILSGLLSKEKQELLSRHIIATKTHSRNSNQDINHFTDADLSVLGASPDEYILYTKQIRKEYKIYPASMYKPGRIRVVRHFLEMNAIFKTDFFYSRMEKQARENLQNELDFLSR